MAEISASIVSYGGYEEVVQAAASILRYTSQPVDLYIIDNASPDGTGKKLERTRFEKPVTVICLSENVGFGKGHNTVLPRLKSKYHFVLNPDILVEEDTLTGMCAWMDEHPDVVMATPHRRKAEPAPPGAQRGQPGGPSGAGLRAAAAVCHPLHHAG